MLRKLMKYDFKTMGRILVPAYLVMLALSVLFGLSLGGNHSYGLVGNIVTSQGYRRTMVTTLGFIFGASCFAGGLITLIMIIQSFYRNLLGAPGHLMFALPVKVRTHVTAKGISATIWVILGCLTGLLSLVLLSTAAFGPHYFGQLLMRFWPGIAEQLGSQKEVVLYVLQIILVLILGAAAEVMRIYASISIGHLWSNHRVFGAVLAYIGFGVIGTLLVNLINFNAVQFEIFLNRIFLYSGAYAGHMALLYFALFELVVAVIYWVITSVILSRRLNLA